MSYKDKIPSPLFAKKWLDHAKSDLKLAKLGLEYDVFPSQICFHAQQTVEKALKAVLLFYKIDFPLTHDLEQLLNILEKANVHLSSKLTEIGILTPYAVETRYPGDWDEITMEEVNRALFLAESALQWAIKTIQAVD